MQHKRNTIKHCLDVYLDHLSPDERSRYLLDNTALIAVILAGQTDEKILSDARRHDEENDTDLFSEVIRLRAYCTACHKHRCTC